jgi:hypothetical protein
MTTRSTSTRPASRPTRAAARSRSPPSAGTASCLNNLYDEGAYNTISWAAVSGAQRYNVYRLSNGLYGFIGQTQSTSYTDQGGANVVAPDISKTPPIIDAPFTGTGNYPGAVSYFEQRRCFAGTINKPANFWATRSGTESSLSYSIPTRDDDSIRFKIASRERTGLRHIVPMANLVLLSESSEWRVAPASGEVLNPDVSVRAQSFIGAAYAQPVLVNNNLIFAAARGGHMRELAYNWQVQGYITGDLSLRAPHLFDGYVIEQMAYAKAPIPIVWAVSSSGELLGFTYVPEQEVGAWHRHSTQDGVFESICVVPEGEEDILYAIVRREMATGTVRFVERMAPRTSDDPVAGFFVDCGLTYSGAAADVITGLGHLERQGGQRAGRRRGRLGAHRLGRLDHPPRRGGDRACRPADRRRFRDPAARLRSTRLRPGAAEERQRDLDQILVVARHQGGPELRPADRGPRPHDRSLWPAASRAEPGGQDHHIAKLEQRRHRLPAP